MWTNFDHFVDACFWLDIILNFNTAYWTPVGDLMTDRWSISKKYIKTWLLIDILSTVSMM